MTLVPDEVLVLLGVLDVEPEDIDGDVLLIETLLHGSHIVRADVVPTTLVIAKGPVSRQSGSSGETCPLREDILGSRSWQDENV